MGQQGSSLPATTTSTTPSPADAVLHDNSTSSQPPPPPSSSTNDATGVWLYNGANPSNPTFVIQDNHAHLVFAQTLLTMMAPLLPPQLKRLIQPLTTAAPPLRQLLHLLLFLPAPMMQQVSCFVVAASVVIASHSSHTSHSHFHPRRHQHNR